MTSPLLARRPFAALAAVLILGLVATACAPGEETPPATEGAGPASLRVAFVPATTTLPLHVAQAQGIFERHNLDVTLSEAGNISDLPATLGRQFDVTMGTATDLIRAGAAGLDVMQVAGNTVSTDANPFVQLIVPADSGITNVSQLRGRTVGTPTLSGVIHVATLYWAQQQGVEPTAIRGVEAPSPNLPDQLRAGRLDAVQALEPFATTLQREGFVSLGSPFSAIADPLATNFFMAQGSWAENNRGAIGRFVQALREADEYIQQNPAEARQILQGFTGMPAPVASTVPLPTYNFDIRTDDLRTWDRVMRSVGQLDRNVDVNRLVLAPAGS
jgi:NitT/TauT family transport system substrate-binding protein